MEFRGAVQASETGKNIIIIIIILILSSSFDIRSIFENLYLHTQSIKCKIYSISWSMTITWAFNHAFDHSLSLSFSLINNFCCSNVWRKRKLLRQFHLTHTKNIYLCHHMVIDSSHIIFFLNSSLTFLWLTVLMRVQVNKLPSIDIK